MTLAEQQIFEPQHVEALELSDYQKACMDNAVAGMLEHLQLFADGEEKEFVRNFVAFDEAHQYALTSLYSQFNSNKEARSEDGEPLRPEYRGIELIGTPVYHPSDTETPVNVRLEAVREQPEKTRTLGKFGIKFLNRQK